MRDRFLLTACVAIALIGLYAHRQIYRLTLAARDAVSSQGLRVTYYNGTDFEKRICSRTEREVVKAYESGRPAWRVKRDRFSARWEGSLIVPETTNYTFYLQADDGARLYIDHKLVMDFWGPHGWNPGMPADVVLKKGRHPFRLEHWDMNNESGIRLRWAGGSIPGNTLLAAPYIVKD